MKNQEENEAPHELEFVCNYADGANQTDPDIEIRVDGHGQFHLVKGDSDISYDKEITPSEAAEFYFNHILPYELKPLFAVRQIN